jgi:flagellin
MPQIINTNISSINAQRNLDKSQSANQQALQRLSSGLRINSAKDDAAGLAISTRFTSQIKGLNVAVRNAGDGIALAQTAEGALGSINENLQRIRELAVQSANATNSDVDRDALQSEVDQLIAQISTTAEDTDFNGRKLLDGSFSATFQVGANAGQTVDVSISELTVDKLGASDQSGVSAQGNANSLQNGDLVINNIAIDPSKSSDDTASTKDAASSSIAKSAAINSVSDQTGVTAFTNENVAAGAEMTGAVEAGTLTLNGVAISLSTSADTVGSRASVVEAINAVSDQTGITAVDSGTNANGVGLVAADGRNIDIAFSGFTSDALASSSTGLAAEATYYGGYTLVADGDVDEIVIAGGDGTGNGNVTNSGLLAGTYEAGAAQVASTVTSLTTGAEFNSAIPTGTVGLQLANAAAVSSGLTAFGTGAETLTVTSNDGQTASVSGGSAGDIGAKEIAAAIDGFTGVSASAETKVKLEAGGGDGLFTGGTIEIFDGSTSGDQLISISLASTAATVEDIANAINDVASSGLVATYVAGATGGASNGDVYITDVDGDSLLISGGAAGGTTSAFDVTVYDSAGTTAAKITGLESASTGAVVTGYLKDVDVTSSDIESLNISTNLTGTHGTGATAGTVTSGSIFNFAETTTGSVNASATGVNSISIDAGQEPVRGLSEGDLTINDVNIAASDPTADKASAITASDGSSIQTSLKTKSAISVADAINKVSDKTGVTAEVNETAVVGSGSAATLATNQTAAIAAGYEAGESGKLYINGVDIGVISLVDDGTGSIDTDATKANTIDLINQKAGQTGVTAEDNGVSITLKAADGRNISVAIDNDSANNEIDPALAGAEGFGSLIGLDSSVSGIGEADIGTATGSDNIGTRGDSSEGAAYETTYSTVKLSSAKEISLQAGSNGKDEIESLGFTVAEYGGGEDGQFLSEIDISTFEGATEALTAIDNAIGQVASQRADLGAVQNRLESTVSNLQVTSENLNAANSRIKDADFAAETAELQRTNVLQQAGISVLAQANASGQQVLSLLG